jgi:hypothetical protein
LACGKEGPWQWDAFLAPTGCLLREAVAALGAFTWAETRPLLEDLTDELAIACKDGTLPKTLSIDQVWLQRNGRAQLADFSLVSSDDGEKGEHPLTGEKLSLELLGQTAALVLEGKPRADTAAAASSSATAEAGRVNAPLPLHVSRFISKLFDASPSPYRSVQELQADLEATREKAREVQRSRRAIHLAILTLFLLGGVVFLMAPVVSSPRAEYVRRLVNKTRESNRALEALNHEAPLGLAVNLTNPDPWARLQAPALWAHDQALQDRLKEKQAALTRDFVDWSSTLPGPQRTWVNLNAAFTSPVGKQDGTSIIQTRRASEGPAEARTASEGGGGADNTKSNHPASKAPAMRAPYPPGYPKPGEFRERIEKLLTEDVRAEPRNEPFFPPTTLSALFWALLWVVWAFVTRGGFSYSWTGLLLVRARDGRKAARWQCAARALLFWLPVCALVVASVALDGWFWSLNDPQPAGLLGWLPHLSLIAWGASLLMFPLYFFLALRSPARSLHDRLVGTCLVPR